MTVGRCDISKTPIPHWPAVIRLEATASRFGKSLMWHLRSLAVSVAERIRLGSRAMQVAGA